MTPFFHVAAVIAALHNFTPTHCATLEEATSFLGERYDLTPKVDEYGDFSRKDPAAAERRHMTLGQYDFGGVESDLRLRTCRMFEVMLREGYEPGITRAFADAYRQHIAVGRKASDNGSYHGSRPELGWGHGQAIDVVSLGINRDDQLKRNQQLWAYIDRYGPSEFGIGRPYGDWDQPHVGPVDGREYLAHHGNSVKVAMHIKHRTRIVQQHRRRIASR